MIETEGRFISVVDEAYLDSLIRDGVQAAIDDGKDFKNDADTVSKFKRINTSYSGL